MLGVIFCCHHTAGF